jgi:hypothetical protein
MVPWRARIPRLEDWPTPPKGLPAAANYDGDTVTLELDRYDDDSTVWDIRMLAVFCPEMNQAGGRECREYVTAWLELHNRGRWPFWVDSVRNKANTDEVQTFTRYVCLVSNADRTAVLNHDVSLFAALNGWTGGIGT